MKAKPIRKTPLLAGVLILACVLTPSPVYALRRQELQEGKKSGLESIVTTLLTVDPDQLVASITTAAGLPTNPAPPAASYAAAGLEDGLSVDQAAQVVTMVLQKQSDSSLQLLTAPLGHFEGRPVVDRNLLPPAPAMKQEALIKMFEETFGVVDGLAVLALPAIAPRSSRPSVHLAVAKAVRVRDFAAPLEPDAAQEMMVNLFQSRLVSNASLYRGSREAAPRKVVTEFRPSDWDVAQRAVRVDSLASWSKPSARIFLEPYGAEGLVAKVVTTRPTAGLEAEPKVPGPGDNQTVKGYLRGVVNALLTHTRNDNKDGVVLSFKVPVLGYQSRYNTYFYPSSSDEKAIDATLDGLLFQLQAAGLHPEQPAVRKLALLGVHPLIAGDDLFWGADLEILPPTKVAAGLEGALSAEQAARVVAAVEREIAGVKLAHRSSDAGRTGARTETLPEPFPRRKALAKRLRDEFEWREGFAVFLQPHDSGEITGVDLWIGEYEAEPYGFPARRFQPSETEEIVRRLLRSSSVREVLLLRGSREALPWRIVAGGIASEDEVALRDLVAHLGPGSDIFLEPLRGNGVVAKVVTTLPAAGLEALPKDSVDELLRDLGAIADGSRWGLFAQGLAQREGFGPQHIREIDCTQLGNYSVSFARDRRDAPTSQPVEGLAVPFQVTRLMRSLGLVSLTISPEAVRVANNQEELRYVLARLPDIVRLMRDTLSNQKEFRWVLIDTGGLSIRGIPAAGLSDGQMSPVGSLLIETDETAAAWPGATILTRADLEQASAGLEALTGEALDQFLADVGAVADGSGWGPYVQRLADREGFEAQHILRINSTRSGSYRAVFFQRGTSVTALVTGKKVPSELTQLMKANRLSSLNIAPEVVRDPLRSRDLRYVLYRLAAVARLFHSARIPVAIDTGQLLIRSIEDEAPEMALIIEPSGEASAWLEAGMSILTLGAVDAIVAATNAAADANTDRSLFVGLDWVERGEFTVYPVERKPERPLSERADFLGMLEMETGGINKLGFFPPGKEYDPAAIEWVSLRDFGYDLARGVEAILDLAEGAYPAVSRAIGMGLASGQYRLGHGSGGILLFRFEMPSTAGLEAVTVQGFSDAATQDSKSVVVIAPSIRELPGLQSALDALQQDAKFNSRILLLPEKVKEEEEDVVFRRLIEPYFNRDISLQLYSHPQDWMAAQFSGVVFDAVNQGLLRPLIWRADLTDVLDLVIGILQGLGVEQSVATEENVQRFLDQLAGLEGQA